MTNYDSHGKYIGTGFGEEKYLHRNVDNKNRPMSAEDFGVDPEYYRKEVNKLNVKTGIEYKKDLVNHPPHYTDGKIEVIDYIHDKKLGFNLGNAIKYISRAGKKNPDKYVEDLEKAIFYIKDEIKRLQNE